MNPLLFLLFLIIILAGSEQSLKSEESTFTISEEPFRNINLNDKNILDQILDEAIDFSKLQKRRLKGETIFYSAIEPTPYTGWSKSMFPNGSIEVLGQFRKGHLTKMTQWYNNGQMKEDGAFSNGFSIKDGLWTSWYENGQKKEELIYTKSKVMWAVIWKPNGEKCPETYVKNGVGIGVNYKKDGTIMNRISLKEGTGWQFVKVDFEQLDIRKNGRGNLYFLGDSLFTGIAKEKLKDDKKEREVAFNDGKLHGGDTEWYENGQKACELIYNFGRVMTATSWKDNGEKCSETDVKNGNGLLVKYAKGGAEVYRDVYKNGELDYKTTRQ
jgi:antitoxin component YwqK of YwqJK toxin-antitoxin module